MYGNWNYGTGRRKSSIARVFIKSGKGEITINGKPIDAYFARETSRMIVNQPFEVTEIQGRYDVIANVRGGGVAAQAQQLTVDKKFFWAHISISVTGN